MKYSSRFFLYAPLGLFLAIAIGVAIHWWLAVAALSARLQAMNGREIVPGVTMRFASRSITGFPFSLDTVFRGFALRIDTPHGATEWRPEEFAMHALTYGRDETIFEAAGKQELRWTKDDGTARDLIFAVGSLHASAIRDLDVLDRFDLDIVGFGSKSLTAQRLQFHLRRTRRFSTFDIFVMVNDMRFPAADSPELGGRITDGRLVGTVTPDWGYERLWTGDQSWFKAADNWRREHGELYVNELSLTWNELKLERIGARVLRLDEAHRPQGSIGLAITGMQRFRQRAAREHLPYGANTGLAGTLLDRTGGGDRTTIDFDFGNGLVMVGGERADTVTPLY
jgi:hypothetical protein